MARTPAPGKPTHHIVRRTARAAAARYNAHAYPGRRARVVKARRGPFRWRAEVVKYVVGD